MISFFVVYDEHDCLLDILNLQVSGLQIFPAVKSDHPSAAAVALFEFGFEKLVYFRIDFFRWRIIYNIEIWIAL